MRVNNHVYWYVDINVGDKVGRDNNGGIDSGVGADFLNGEGEGFKV